MTNDYLGGRKLQLFGGHACSDRRRSFNGSLKCLDEGTRHVDLHNRLTIVLQPVVEFMVRVIVTVKVREDARWKIW